MAWGMLALYRLNRRVCDAAAFGRSRRYRRDLPARQRQARRVAHGDRAAAAARGQPLSEPIDPLARLVHLTAVAGSPSGDTPGRTNRVWAGAAPRPAVIEQGGGASPPTASKGARGSPRPNRGPAPPRRRASPSPTATGRSRPSPLFARHSQGFRAMPLGRHGIVSRGERATGTERRRLKRPRSGRAPVSASTSAERSSAARPVRVCALAPRFCCSIVPPWTSPVPTRRLRRRDRPRAACRAGCCGLPSVSS